MRIERKWVVSLVLVLAVHGAAPAAQAQSVLDSPAKYGLESEPTGITDHDLVAGSWGFQVVSNQLDALVEMNLLGVRYWITSTVGVDLGACALLRDPHGDADVQAGFALCAGVPMSVKAHKHLSLYLEPKFDYGIWRPKEGSTPWRFDLGGWFGAEVTLGWIGIPRLSFLAEMGVGLTVVNNGDDNEVTFSTRSGTTFPWMFSNNVGVVYYF